MPDLRFRALWRGPFGLERCQAPPGLNLRTALADQLGVLASGLVAVDVHGVDHASSETGGEAGPPEVVVSFSPVRFPRPLLATPPWHRWEGAGALGVGEDLASGEPAEREPMTEGEQRLAVGLMQLGLGIDPADLDLPALAAAFPPLEGGWGITRPSPYRFFFAAALTASELTEDTLHRLEGQVEETARGLKDRLHLGEPDALDLELHLLAETGPQGDELLSRLVPSKASRAWDGRRHAGWRRVVVHRYRDESDRQAQLACLGRTVTAQRRDPALRRRIQEELATFNHLFTEDSWLELRAIVSVRPAERGLRLAAERLLLERIRRELSATQASDGLSRDLTRGLLARTGLLERLFEEEGPRLGERLWQFARPIVDHGERSQFGTTLSDLSPADEAKVRAWLVALRAAPPADPLASEELARVLATGVADFVCRLHFALESLLDQKVFPPVGRCEVPFPQLLHLLGALREDLSLKAGASQPQPGEGGGGLLTSLLERRSELAERLPGLLAAVQRAGDDLFLFSHRLKSLLGGGTTRVRDQLASAVADWQRAWLEHRLLGYMLEEGRAGLARGLEFVTEIQEGLQRISSSAGELADAVAKELADRDRCELVGAQSPSDLPVLILERLRRGVEELPLAAALRQAARKEGELRDLARLPTETLLSDLLAELTPSMAQLVASIARDPDLPDLSLDLGAAVERLFTGSGLPDHGREGQLGAFDDRTLLIAISPVELARQGDASERLSTLRQRLADHGVRSETPVVEITSQAVSSLLLVRCVAALSLQEVVG